MRLKKTVLHSAITGIFLILILLSSCNFNEREILKPLAVGGVLDLSEWDFNINGPVRLDGQWEFRWQKQILPENPRQDKNPDRQSFINVPGAWNNHLINGYKIPGKGLILYQISPIFSRTMIWEQEIGGSIPLIPIIKKTNPVINGLVFLLIKYLITLTELTIFGKFYSYYAPILYTCNTFDKSVPYHSAHNACRGGGSY